MSDDFQNFIPKDLVVMHGCKVSFTKEDGIGAVVVAQNTQQAHVCCGYLHAEGFIPAGKDIMVMIKKGLTV